jgi:hypothetical protein
MKVDEAETSLATCKPTLVVYHGTVTRKKQVVPKNKNKLIHQDNHPHITTNDTSTLPTGVSQLVRHEPPKRS